MKFEIQNKLQLNHFDFWQGKSQKATRKTQSGGGGVSHLADCLTVRAIGIAVTSQIWPNLFALSSVIITTSLAAGVVGIGLGSS